MCGSLARRWETSPCTGGGFKLSSSDAGRIVRKDKSGCLILHERRSEIDEKERERKTKRWKMAVERSLGWDLEAMSTDD